MVRSKAAETAEAQDEAGAEEAAATRTPPVDEEQAEEPLSLRRMRGIDKTKCLIPGCLEPLLSSSSQRTLICAAHCITPFVVVDPARGRLRFCQKCAKLQLLSDFDAEKRTCRRMLQRHNDRRREKYRQRKEQAAANAPDDAAAPSQEAAEEEAAAAGAEGAFDEYVLPPVVPPPVGLSGASPPPAQQAKCTSVTHPHPSHCVRSFVAVQPARAAGLVPPAHLAAACHDVRAAGHAGAAGSRRGRRSRRRGHRSRARPADGCSAAAGSAATARLQPAARAAAFRPARRAAGAYDAVAAGSHAGWHRVGSDGCLLRGAGGGAPPVCAAPRDDAAAPAAASTRAASVRGLRAPA